MVMTNEGLQYLRNINTKPGPDAGRSIDPTKPGPDDKIKQSDAQPVAWQIRTKLTRGRWTFWLGEGKPNLDPHFYEARPLFLAPASPDDKNRNR